MKHLWVWTKTRRSGTHWKKSWLILFYFAILSFLFLFLIETFFRLYFFRHSQHNTLELFRCRMLKFHYVCVLIFQLSFIMRVVQEIHHQRMTVEGAITLDWIWSIDDSLAQSQCCVKHKLNSITLDQSSMAICNNSNSPWSVIVCFKFKFSFLPLSLNRMKYFTIWF